MRSVSIRLEDLCKITIPIGFAGENLRTTVRIDCMKMFQDYPDAIATLSVKPPEGKPYPTVVTRDGDIVIWEVTSSDLASQGYGEIQLSFLVDDVVAKSFVGKTRVDKSILPTGQAPDPINDWIVRAEAALEGIPATIQAALEEAKESGEFDGFSPIATVTKEGTVATITITDKNGTTTATVEDGAGSDSVYIVYMSRVEQETQNPDDIPKEIEPTNQEDVNPGEQQDIDPGHQLPEIDNTNIPTTPVTDANIILDKTFAEIKQAHDEGKFVLVINNELVDNEYIGNMYFYVAGIEVWNGTEGIITLIGQGNHIVTFVSDQLDDNPVLESDNIIGVDNVLVDGISVVDKNGVANIPYASDTDAGVIMLDDTAGTGDADKAWSADKLTSEFDLKAPKASPVFTGSISMGRLESYATGDKSVAIGDSVEASAYAAFAEGGGTRARGRFSHSEGEATTASGQGSHAEGTGTQATATQAHAEGLTTTASASYTHAEGSNTTASSVGAHAEGMFSTASGMASHSQGFRTIANANFMSASGIYNKQADIYPAWVAGTSYEVGDRVTIAGAMYLECKIANSDETFDWTKWEEIDFSSDTLFVIGNGIDESHRSNAMEIDLHGNENLTGDLTVNKGSANEISVGTIKTDLDSKAPIANPEFTGSISMGRAKNTTIGAKSVAIGASAEATAPHSVSLGIANRANMAAFAQGDSNNASAYCSFAQGFGNIAKGNYSSATGFNSVISGNASHAFGRYNEDLNDGTEPDSLGTYIEIVGNGTGDNDRSNARTLDQSGNENLSGDLKIFAGTNNEVSISSLKNAINVLTPSATSSDVGKFLKAKTVSDGKVTEYEFGSGGGSGGTDDYSDLSNKPQINGVTLAGNKSATDLGLLSGQGVTEAVDDYLEENFSNPSNPPLDRTLSSELSAAPADMVGEIKNAINNNKMLTPSAVNSLIGILRAGVYSQSVAAKLEILEQELNAQIIPGTFSVAYLLNHAESSNTSNTVTEGASYTTTITASGTGYEIESVNVTMGGLDITDTAYDDSTGVISVSNVNGDLLITAVAATTEYLIPIRASNPDQTTFIYTQSTWMDTIVFENSNISGGTMIVTFDDSVVTKWQFGVYLLDSNKDPLKFTGYKNPENLNVEGDWTPVWYTAGTTGGSFGTAAKSFRLDIPDGCYAFLYLRWNDAVYGGSTVTNGATARQWVMNDNGIMVGIKGGIADGN